MKICSPRVAMFFAAAFATLAARVCADDGHSTTAPQAPVAEGELLLVSGDTCFEGHRLREWVECLREGRCEELERCGAEAVAVWRFAARDAEAAFQVHCAMVNRFAGQAWTAKVYQSMLDGAHVFDRGIAVDALLADKPNLKESAPIIVGRMVDWASSEQAELHDLVDSSLTAVQARGPLPVDDTMVLVKSLYPVASRQLELPFRSCKLIHLLAPCGPQGAELALTLFADQPSRSFVQQIYVHYADSDALQTLAQICRNGQHPQRMVAARMLEHRMSIQGIDQPAFIAPALEAFHAEKVSECTGAIPD